MSGVTQERSQALLQSAKHWREYAATCSQGIGSRAAISAAVSLERQVEDGVVRCACCQKQIGQHTGIVR